MAPDPNLVGRHHRLPAWRSIASCSGSGKISRTSCAQRHATAILAAHSSASSREGTSTIASPPMTSLVSGYGPSVTVPSVATTLARCLSSPPLKTHTPAFTASWTASCAALLTAGMSSSGMWSIAPSSNEIRYRVIPRLPCPGGLLRPPLMCPTNASIPMRHSARRQSHGGSAGWPPRASCTPALPQLVAAACQIRDLGRVACQVDGLVVRRARLLTAAEPTQQVGAGRMVGVIAGQLALQPVDSRQCHLRAVKLGDRDGAVEGDDRRGVELDKLV